MSAHFSINYSSELIYAYSSLVKEDIMLKNRIFYIVVTVALLVTAALSINQTVASAKVISDVAGQAVAMTSTSPSAACPFSTQDLRSLRAVYMPDMGIWLPRTGRGDAGQDGGALCLLNCPTVNAR
jgi:hypothetical protein